MDVTCNACGGDGWKHRKVNDMVVYTLTPCVSCKGYGIVHIPTNIILGDE